MKYKLCIKMTLEANDIAYKVVYLTCLAASIFMVQQHLRKFLENKDTSSLQFKKFPERKNKCLSKPNCLLQG